MTYESENDDSKTLKFCGDSVDDAGRHHYEDVIPDVHYITKGNIVQISFITDGSNDDTEKGFQIEYHCVIPTPTTTAISTTTTTDDETECGPSSLSGPNGH